MSQNKVVNSQKNRSRTERASARSRSRQSLRHFGLESLEMRRVLAWSSTVAIPNTVANWLGNDAVNPLVFSIAPGGAVYQHNQFGVSPGFNSPQDFDDVIPGDQFINVAIGSQMNVVCTPATLNNGLEIDLSADPNPQSIAFFNIAGPGLTGFVSTNIGSFTYDSGVNPLTVRGGSGGNQITLNDNLPGTKLFVYAGTGSDMVQVNNIQGNSSSIPELFLYGEAGSDSIIIGNVSFPVVVDGGSQNDIIDATQVTQPSVTLWGGAGNDRIIGGNASSTINGGAGNDTLFGGLARDEFIWKYGDGADIVDGRGGADVVSMQGNLIAANNAKVTRTSNGFLADFSAGQSVTGYSVPNLELYSAGAQNDTYTVYNMEQTSLQRIFLNGAGAASAIFNWYGTLGPDTLALGQSGQNQPNQFEIDGFAYQAIMEKSATGTTKTSIFGDAGNDNIKANPNVNSLTSVQLSGDNGDDYLSADATLLGGNGDDTLKGGIGNDSLDGGNGNDTYIPTSGVDIINDTGLASDADRILIEGTSTYDDLYINELFNVSDSTVTITQYTSNIFVQSSVNTVSNVENIEIYSFGGSDSLYVSAALGTGTDNSQAVGIRAFMGTEHDLIDATNVPLDNPLKVVAYGEAGNDTFQGGSGQDFFYGGDDSDWFVFNKDGTSQSNVSIYEGGSGNNLLEVRADSVNVWADSDGTIRANINSGAYGWLYSDDVTTLWLTPRGTNNINTVFDLSHSTVQTLLYIPQVASQNTLNLYGSLESEVITVDAANQSIFPTVLEVSGLNYNAYLGDQLSQWDSNDTLNIFGQAGKDSFHATANNSSTINFHGELGNDDLLINGNSVAANFIGGQGVNSVEIEGTVGIDLIGIVETATGVYNLTLNTVVTTASGIDTVIANGLVGNDIFTVATLPTAQNPYAIRLQLLGDLGNDSFSLTGVQNGYVEVSGGAGNDSISGPTAAIFSSLSGDAGNDNIAGGDANDLIYGGDDNDNLSGGKGIDSIYGGNGNDAIAGNEGDDNLYGEGGADTFSWSLGDGNDQLDGGLGQDAMVFSGHTTNDNEFSISSVPGPAAPGIFGPGLSNLAITSLVGDGNVTSTDLEHVSLQGGSGCDKFNIGNMQQTSVTLVDANFGAGDTSPNLAIVNGTDTADNIVISSPQTGQVNVNGLPALVRLFNTQRSSDTLFLNAGAGDDKISITAAAINEIYTVIEAGDGNDYISGFSFASGGDGNDTIIGTAGPDTLLGGPGDDLVDGLAGNDLLFGDGAIIGLVPDSAHDCPMNPFGVITFDNSVGSGNDTVIGGTGADQMHGGAGDDLMSGGDNNDMMMGEDGNDTMDGGNGQDVMWGQNGTDSMIGGLGQDMMYGGEGNDYMLGGIPANVNVKHRPRKRGLVNDGNDTMLGGNGLDSVDGGTGNNLLDAGNDNIREVILGGHGNDMAYTHRDTNVNFDVTALDGGFQHIFNQGELSEPPVVDNTFGYDVTYAVPLFFYTGHIFYPGGNVVEHPPLSEMIARGRTQIPPAPASVKTTPAVKAAKSAAARLTARRNRTV